MRRNVVGCLLGFALTQAIVVPMAAQEGRAESRSTAEMRRHEEMKDRSRPSKPPPKGSLNPRGPIKVQPDSILRDTPVQLHHVDLSPRNGALGKNPPAGVFHSPFQFDYAKPGDRKPFQLLVPLLHLSGNRYRLSDASGAVHYLGDSQRELGARLNQMLSASAGPSIAMEFSGVSEDKAQALATSLRLQQRQIDSKVSIRILPHSAEDGTLSDIFATHTLWLERTDPQNVVFAGRPGQAVKQATVWIVEGMKELVKEFFALLFSRLTFDSDSQQSLSDLVWAARQELKAKHGNLTKEQFRLKVTGQFGTIDLGLLRPELSPAWS